MILKPVAKLNYLEFFIKLLKAIDVGDYVVFRHDYFRLQHLQEKLRREEIEHGISITSDTVLLTDSNNYFYRIYKTRDVFKSGGDITKEVKSQVRKEKAIRRRKICSIQNPMKNTLPILQNHLKMKQ